MAVGLPPGGVSIDSGLCGRLDLSRLGCSILYLWVLEVMGSLLRVLSLNTLLGWAGVLFVRASLGLVGAVRASIVGGEEGGMIGQRQE